MLPKFSQATYESEPVSCKKCGWSGTGADVILIDFYGITDSQDLYCPECDKKIGTLVKEKRTDPPVDNTGGPGL